MSDADFVREWIGGCLALHGFREDCPACVAYRDANAALDRLEAARGAAEWLVAVRGHRGEQHAWELLEKALAPKDAEGT